MPRRNRDEYDDDSDEYDRDRDIDRDPDEKYRRRIDRYGEEVTDEEEEQEEKETADSEAIARKKTLWPGLLMTVAGVGTLLGTVAFVAAITAAAGTGQGPGPGAAATWVSMGICAGIPLLFTLAFCVLQTIAGVCLLRRKGRGMAMTGGLLGVLGAIPLFIVGLIGGWPDSLWMPLGPCLLGVPAAVWMFVAVNDLHVQDAFARNRERD